MYEEKCVNRNEREETKKKKKIIPKNMWDVNYKDSNNNTDYVRDQRANGYFLNLKEEREKCTQKYTVKEDDFLNTDALVMACEILWNALNPEKENCIDLFNDRIYNFLTKIGEEKFKNLILPYFIANAKSIHDLKNLLSEKKGQKYNESFASCSIKELKRITNENNLSLIVNYQEQSDLRVKTNAHGMLIIPKNVFFNFIKKIILMNDHLANSDSALFRVFLLEMLKNKDKFFINIEGNFLKKHDQGKDDNLVKENKNLLNDKDVYYRIKKGKKKKNENSDNTNSNKENPLLREDYKLIERARSLNDIIHNSIMHISKKKKNSTKEDAENLSFLKCVSLNKKKYDQIMYKKRRENYNDPLHILKEFLKKDNNTLNYNEIVNELRSCTFQPNICKYILAEADNIINKDKFCIIKEEKRYKGEIEKLFKNIHNSSITDEMHKYILNNTQIEHANDEENRNIMKYIEMYYIQYCANKRTNTKGSLIKYYDECCQPEHRLSRHITRSATNACNSKYNVNMMKERKKSEGITTKGKNTWINELRGGYLSNCFNFSIIDKNERIDKNKQKHEQMKLARVQEFNWHKEIRLKGRRLRTKVIPNLDISNKFMRNLHSVNYTFDKFAQTVDTHKKTKYFSENDKYDDDKPNNKNIQVNYESLKFQDMHKNNNITSSSIHAGNKKIFNFKNGKHTQKKKKKSYEHKDIVEREKILNDFNKFCSFIPPPKVIAVKSDHTTLEDIEKELLSLPSSVQYLQIL
ncbi:conserved Plasmodium protein, unknown function [Plasmodium malariae]|uniref:Uncharacterized protein n=1 Tax=Plasmodium malariae TaxID=5858 RepID=A0A1C3L1P7_PLAMA|nr:conserved Plasmodium protein, unknown function [Plasmodium malariae]